jgi:DNA-binding CsgD family transcriptional regulator
VGKSVSLRLDDVRAVFRLVGECKDVGYDPALWLARMGEGLSRLLDARFVMGGEFRMVDGRPVPVLAVDLGWPNERAKQLWIEWHSGDHSPSPVHERFLAIDHPAPTVGMDDGHLMPVEEYRRSAFYNEMCVIADADDTLVSRRQLPGGTPHVVNVSRGFGDRPFTRREKVLFALFHTELAAHFGAALATSADPVARLTPRLRQVLDCLLDGDSEKQAAAKLGVRPVTVHDHVKRLYAHFGVTTRSELMAYFLRRYRR